MINRYPVLTVIKPIIGRP